MKILLDTHALIWMDTDPTQLSATAVACFNDPANDIWLSVVSVWEVVIKVGTGKLALSGDIDQIVRDIQAQNPLQLLDIQYPHALAVRGLPPIHRDPFDRMLVAQALVENATILTCDANIRRYPVMTIW